MEKILNGTEGFVDKQPLKNFWYVVALGDDIDSNPISVKLLNEDLVIWRGFAGCLIAAAEKCQNFELTGQ